MAGAIQRFVYYAVAEADLAEVVAAVVAMQRRLVIAHPGLEADRLRRPGATDGRVTLMEIYCSPEGVSDPLGRAIEAEAALTLAGSLAGSRHLEDFEPL